MASLTFALTIPSPFVLCPLSHLIAFRLVQLGIRIGVGRGVCAVLDGSVLRGSWCDCSHTVPSRQRAAASEPDQRGQLHSLHRRSVPRPCSARLGRPPCRVGLLVMGVCDALTWLIRFHLRLCLHVFACPLRKIRNCHRHGQLRRVRHGKVRSCSGRRLVQRLCCGTVSGRDRTERVFDVRRRSALFNGGGSVPSRDAEIGPRSALVSAHIHSLPLTLVVSLLKRLRLGSCCN